jgi:hypothetical protein
MRPELLMGTSREEGRAIPVRIGHDDGWHPLRLVKRELQFARLDGG